MTSKERVLNRERLRGRLDAEQLQKNSAKMTGTQLYQNEQKIPRFTSARKVKNMLERKAGFVCKSSAGRIVKLLQPYDSNIYTDEPEQLPAQWGFKWSTDPQFALAFIQIATAPYNKGDCCIFEDKKYRSKIDNNVHSPKDYKDGWELIEWS